MLENKQAGSEITLNILLAQLADIQSKMCRIEHNLETFEKMSDEGTLKITANLLRHQLMQTQTDLISHIDNAVSSLVDVGFTNFDLDHYQFGE